VHCLAGSQAEEEVLAELMEEDVALTKKGLGEI
jgi:hypothetical protein